MPNEKVVQNCKMRKKVNNGERNCFCSLNKKKSKASSVCADAFTLHYFLHSPKCTLHETGLLRGLDYKTFFLVMGSLLGSPRFCLASTLHVCLVLALQSLSKMLTLLHTTWIKLYKLHRCLCISCFPFELGYMSKESKTPSHHHQRQLCKFKAARVNLIYSGDCLISTGVIVYNIAVILCMDEKSLRWVQRHSEWSSQTMHSILTNVMKLSS